MTAALLALYAEPPAPERVPATDAVATMAPGVRIARILHEHSKLTHQTYKQEQIHHKQRTRKRHILAPTRTLTQTQTYTHMQGNCASTPNRTCNNTRSALSSHRDTDTHTHTHTHTHGNTHTHTSSIDTQDTRQQQQTHGYKWTCVCHTQDQTHSQVAQ